MKSKASFFLKRMLSFLEALGKAKALAAKCKTSTAKTRLLFLGLFRSKKMIFSSITHKLRIHAAQEKIHDNLPLFLAPKEEITEEVVKEEEEEENDDDEDEDDDDDNDDDRYPDLRHSLFDDDVTGSVIEMVKNARGEDQGEFVLENEIDHVADVFIRRFHRQIMLQKLESFKRNQESSRSTV